MSGYAWVPRARMTPFNGPAVVVDLSADGFSIANSRTTVLTHIGLDYQPEVERRRTINYDERPLLSGFRGELALRFEVRDMTHYRTVALLASRLMDPGWKVELSLDAGQLYREIVLRRGPTLRPFREKTVAGVRVDLTVATKSTFAELALIEGGARW